MDVTFQSIWTPLGTYEERKRYYSGKHKQYGLKSQCIHDRTGKLIHCISGIPGSVHDLTIARESIEVVRYILLDLTNCRFEDCWKMKNLTNSPGRSWLILGIKVFNASFLLFFHTKGDLAGFLHEPKTNTIVFLLETGSYVNNSMGV